MIWADYRDDWLRPLLKDTSTQVNWTDDELLQYANWGIIDLNRVAPMLVSVSLTGTGPTYNLPDDFDDVLSITIAENDRTYFLPRLDPRDIETLPFDEVSSSSTNGYMIDWPAEGTLWVSPLRNSGTYSMGYWAARGSIDDDDTVLPFGRHQWLSQALACYVAYCAHLREGVGRAALEQWAQRPDLNVGNPLNVEALEWLRAYNRLISDHRNR